MTMVSISTDYFFFLCPLPVKVELTVLVVAFKHGIYFQRGGGSDIYQGFIRVHMNLLRPINIIAGERPLSIFESVAGQKSEEDQKV